MITNKNDLQFYLTADKFSLGIKYNRPKINDEIWKFQIALRKVEYYKNTNTNFIKKILLRLWQLKKHKLAIKLGFDIPENVCGAGLRINHFGNLVISKQAQIGLWCDIHQGVNIGANNAPDKKTYAPTIMNNVWIGPGAKLFGDIKVGSHVAIGANSVVNKNVVDEVTVAGIPAKIINKNSTKNMNISASERNMLQFFKLHPQYSEYSPI